MHAALPHTRLHLRPTAKAPQRTGLLSRQRCPATRAHRARKQRSQERTASYDTARHGHAMSPASGLSRPLRARDTECHSTWCAASVKPQTGGGGQHGVAGSRKSQGPAEYRNIEMRPGEGRLMHQKPVRERVRDVAPPFQVPSFPLRARACRTPGLHSARAGAVAEFCACDVRAASRNACAASVRPRIRAKLRRGAARPVAAQAQTLQPAGARQRSPKARTQHRARTLGIGGARGRAPYDKLAQCSSPSHRLRRVLRGPPRARGLPPCLAAALPGGCTGSTRVQRLLSSPRSRARTKVRFLPAGALARRRSRLQFTWIIVYVNGSGRASDAGGPEQRAAVTSTQRPAAVWIDGSPGVAARAPHRATRMY